MADVQTLNLTDSQQSDLAVVATDKRGNPASVQNPVWSSSDETIVTVAASADNPMAATVKAVGPLGTATVKFDADADLGDGVTDIFGLLNVAVGAGPASQVVISAGAPVEQA